jgi:hypothetical protein
MDSLTQVSGRRALLVLSDGMDTAEPEEIEELKQGVIRKSQELQIPLFMVCTSSGQADMKGLEDMARGSPGGQFFPAAKPQELKEIFENITRSLQDEYTLTYTSPDPVENGVKRNVTVNIYSDSVGKQVTGSYPVPGVIATGAGSGRGSGAGDGGPGLASLALVFVCLSGLLGLLLGAPYVVRARPRWLADEPAPARPAPPPAARSASAAITPRAPAAPPPKRPGKP